MPTAVYSWRAMSPKRSTSSSSRVAARPIDSGQLENGPAIIPASGLSLNEWRGSVEMVTGMPRRVDAASSWRALCHCAMSSAVGAEPSTLKCVMPAPITYSSFDGRPNIGSPGASPPSWLMEIMVWKNRPAFSSRVIWPRRFSTRSSTGREASRYVGSTGSSSAAPVTSMVSVMSYLTPLIR